MEPFSAKPGRVPKLLNGAAAWLCDLCLWLMLDAKSSDSAQPSPIG